MNEDELLQTARYVTDSDGNLQAVQLDLEIWHKILQHLDLNNDPQIFEERQSAMRREEAAYQAMHDELYENYPGQHVAIFQGQLVDRDEDSVALYRRIRQKYPGEFVLMTRVKRERVETYRYSHIPFLAELPVPPAGPDANVERERAAYLRLYPQLQQTHSGEYVAIYGGHLVDFDTDEAALFARIDDKYPDEFVWLAFVDDPPERDIRLR
jgi:hypothetical protein